MLISISSVNSIAILFRLTSDIKVNKPNKYSKNYNELKN